MTQEGVPSSRTNGKYVMAAAAVLLLVAAAIWFGVPARLQVGLQAALDWIRDLGWWGPGIFILLYMTATVAFVPGSVLTLGAGAVFGVVKGFICVSIGALLGATTAFLVGRYLARDWIARKIESQPRFKAVDQAVGREGWKIILLMRLSPAFPFWLLNYAFGLTRIPLKQYFLATWIGMIPGTLMYVYIGSLARAGARETSTAEWILRGIGLLATLAVTLFVTRIARRALSDKLPGEPATTNPAQAEVG